MNRRKFAAITCLAMLVAALWGFSPPRAEAIDGTKIPQYFGPYPNWALSPLPVVTPGTCSVTTATTCTTDASCPTGETCQGVTVTGGIKKFQDGLPGLCNPSVAAGQPGNCDAAKNNLGQYIPLAVPDTTTFTTAAGRGPDADYYVIAVVQHRERMSSSLHPNPVDGNGNPVGTLLREYVQLETPANSSWSKHVALRTDLPDGTSTPVLMPDGSQAYGVDAPHYLGPVIAATKDKPVRIVFYNLLPKGIDGNLFLPVDSSLMGSGKGPVGGMDPDDQGLVTDMVRNPACTDATKGTDPDCFKDNRATLHLHGGITPWISDGTPHQWITPANETTAWPEGVSVTSVPDMINVPGVPNCSAPNDGCMTFYYTNQQSARLMFYHDHSWGITRLNVYAGEAAGYLISDATEQKLITDGTIPGAAATIPLVIQDRTFVPAPSQMADLDPTWDYTRWGKEGDFWYHHVYMPAQNPGDAGGMSGFGRWMYGPWFWPPATPPHGPIANPRYNMDPKGPDGILGTPDDFTTPIVDPNTLQPVACSIDNPATWQYQTDPFCEPPLIPGTPNISVGMEQFNDTPLVNGTAYPTTTVEPKTYRLRILNAANDRFFNLQWYIADATGTEVALKASEVAAAQLDPNVFPTPDTTLSPAGPDWIQIGTEGGFLPAPVVIPAQPITWITDPTRFDVGNVDQHSLALAPAERADVIVDFSQFAGKTLILYNDAPAAYPARVSSYDYYTGAPDQWPVSAPSIIPGYGPNTRTVMQVKVVGSAAPAYNLQALRDAFAHKPDGSGVFESGQHPIIVGQAAYNSAYYDAGINTFASNSWCNVPGMNIGTCDGFARISDQGGGFFSFNTLSNPASKLALPVQPKAIHDEMNSVSFDEFGRMTANLGVEAVPATPGLQNITLYPYVNPVTELIDGTNLPKAEMSILPISTQDGTQIWKITHNGVDTHPIHFHLYDVQVINRVTWDNIIIPPDANELGWKDTVRISPLEDTIVALRPIIPSLPFDLPNSIHKLNPMVTPGSMMGFNNIDPQGNPTASITNDLVNFGWEYVYHCHILSHEEMDMMRPVSLALPPKQPTNLSVSLTTVGQNTNIVLTWDDNSLNETSFLVQKTLDGQNWTDVGTSVSPLDQPNITGLRTLTDPATYGLNDGVTYRVVAQNTVGYGGDFPSMTVTSVSDPLSVTLPSASAPGAPTGVTAVAGNTQATVSFTAPASNGGSPILTYSVTSTPGNITVTGTASPITVTGLTNGTAYTFTVTATNAIGTGPASVPSNSVTPATVPGAPTIGTATAGNTTATVAFTAPANGGAPITLYTVTSSPGGKTATGNASPITVTGLTNGTAYTFTVTATNVMGTGPASAASNSVTPATVPTAPVMSFATAGAAQATINFAAPASNGGSPIIDYTVTSSPGGFTATGSSSPITVTGLANTAYTFTVTARNAIGTGPASSASNNVTPFVAPGAPVIGTATAGNAQATVTFSPPVTDGGSAIILYAVTASNGAVAYGLASPITVMGLTNGTSYTFTVTATNSAGTGAASAPSNAVVPTGTKPVAPTALVATLSPLSTAPPTVTLTWTDRSIDEVNFIIERATNSAFTAGLTTFTVPANTTTYTDTTVVARVRYYYRVRAVNWVGASANTRAVSVIPRQLPLAPTNLAVGSATSTSLTLTWTDNASNETGFTIQRSTTGTGNWSTIARVAANTTTYTNTRLARNRTYWYRVQAYNADGTSTFTTAASGTTLP